MKVGFVGWRGMVGSVLMQRLLENTMTLGVAAVTAGRAGTQVRARNIQQTKLVEELTANGIKFNPNNVVAITKTTDGKIVWLETGNSRAGLNHIIERHRQEFLKKGISESEIPNYLMTAVKNGQIVGMQRTRPIYEFTYNGTKHRVAIGIGNNGLRPLQNSPKSPKFPSRQLGDFP